MLAEYEKLLSPSISVALKLISILLSSWPFWIGRATTTGGSFTGVISTSNDVFTV